MKKQQHTNFVTVALFFGVLCTFMIYFGLTAVMSDEPLGYDIETKLERAVYDNASLQKIIKNIDFSLFSQVDNDNVIIGQNGFLFERTDSKNGYSYLLDYQGELSFTEEELEIIRHNIELRYAAYENAGREYLLVIVPNAQTVYSENMPFYYGSISENTRLSQLRTYFDDMGVDCFLDATDVLMSSKGHGLLYNNTENSLNALGAYAVYRAVLEKLDGALPEGFDAYELTSSDFYSHLDSGRAIARSAGAQNLVPNRTVSLSTLPPNDYGLISEYEELIVTKSDLGSGVSLMIECNAEWNRIIMQPYFSNTFDSVAYKENQLFSPLLNENTESDIVIQFVYEYELDSLISQNVALTYGAGFEKPGNVMNTQAPTLLGVTYTDKNTICLFGLAEEKSNVFFEISGRETVTRSATGGIFFAEINAEGLFGSVDVTISAKYGGKKQSNEVQYTLKLGAGPEKREVSIGQGSQIFDVKYRIDAYQSAADALLSIPKAIDMNSIRISADKETEYICAIVPTKLTFYGDESPSELFLTADKLSELRKLYAERDEDKITVLDLAPLLSQSEKDGLYYKTDSLPTDTGAYEIYCAIVDSVGLPRAVTEDEISCELRYIPGGALISKMGLNSTVVCEYAEKLTIKDRGVTYYYSDPNDTTRRYVTENEDESLPTAIILYDEQGASCLEYLAENFSKAIFYPQGAFMIDINDVEELRPDYIIKIVGEDNLTE